MCLYASEVVGSPCRIEGRDFVAEQALDMETVNTSPNALMAPAFAAGKKLLAFEAWNRPGGSGRWDVVLYDMTRGEFVELPLLNTAMHDERKPSISTDGRWIAFTTNRASRESLTDVALYDRSVSERFLPTGLNSPAMDTEPALSADGRWLAFVSDRPGGVGARDVYLYDRTEERLVELPGLNSVGQEQSPAITANGRFLAFVSERLDGTGERDVYLYDRERQSLLPTPELNSPEDEYDPMIVIPPAR